MVKTPFGPFFRAILPSLVAGCLASTVLAAPVAIPFVENFNTGTSVFSAGGGWSYVGQKYRVSASGSSTSAASSVEAPAMPEGFRMEATFSGLVNNGTENTCGFGFLGTDANFTGGSSPYYLADLKPALNKVRLIQVASPSNIDFINNESLSFPLNLTQPFKLTVEGEYDGPILRMRMIVTQGANQSIHAYDEDTPLTGPYFGLRTRSNGTSITVDHDDFSLKKLTTVAFTGSPTAYAQPGQPYSSTITAATSASGPITFSPVDLPAWLSLTDLGNGTATLSGTPPVGVTGSLVMKIRADDSNSVPLTQEFPLKVLGISGVVISEFVASNDGTFVDEDGDDSDWLEIFNATPNVADIGGWMLKDDKASWSFPNGTSIAPFGTLVVFASDKNRTGGPYFHTNFKLSASAGGQLSLVRPDLSVASQYLSYPAQRDGASYGLWGDYQSTGIMIPATPGVPNPSTGYVAFSTDPTFSVPRGFHDTAQNVTIACPLPGSTISYTLDGSPPTPTHGTLVPPVDAASTPSVTLNVGTTTAIRAITFKDTYVPSAPITHTYLFTNDLATQSANGLPPAGWPTGSVNGQILDYGMDPDITNIPGNVDLIKSALRSLPTFSIVTDRASLFDPVKGIYVNATGREKEWEEPVSMEMIKPDGTGAFQINCGIRMRGGVSRADTNPKHSFHFYFRGEYGAGKLEYPLFDSDGAPEFDRIDLRSTQGSLAWHTSGSTASTYMRDEWSRATQGAMGHAHARSRFVHLCINGQYWGIYATQERADDFFAASYFGGEKEDYDMIKTYTFPAHHVAVADGDATAWNALHAAATAGFTDDAAYHAVQGLAPDGSPSPTIKPLVDIDNLIDYMILNMYTSNTDGPVNPGSKNVPKNFFCFRPRNGAFGFRFVAHDFEDTFGGTDVTGHLTTDGQNPVAGATLEYFNPRWLHLQLVRNPKYLMRFGDRVQRNLYNNGALTVASATARWTEMRSVLEPAIITESARWGDFKSATPRTIDDWKTACDGFFKASNSSGTLVSRHASFISLLRSTSRGYALFPSASVTAPVLSQAGGIIPANGYDLSITGPSSTQIFYTLNGSEPSSPSAIPYSTPVRLNAASITVKARVRHLTTNEWSPLTEATFTQLPVPAAVGNLYLSELHYNPSTGGETLDFIEVRNPSTSIVDLTNASLNNGLTFTFPALNLLPGESIVVVENKSAFETFYGTSIRVAGVWDGALSNGGETIELRAAGSTIIESVAYVDRPSPGAQWPTAPDGNGPS
ncbi:MAG TPA: lamin tail domain-containing protein, partial [Luteolibacter sp.]|nr:lamin tail domain-containing protein [Luteolibacter sp.]